MRGQMVSSNAAPHRDGIWSQGRAGRLPVAKHEQRAREWVTHQLRLADAAQPVYPSTEVDRLDHHQHARLGCDLDHARLLKKLCTTSVRSSPSALSIRMRSPLRRISSMVNAGRRVEGASCTDTNCGPSPCA